MIDQTSAIADPKGVKEVFQLLSDTLQQSSFLALSELEQMQALEQVEVSLLDPGVVRTSKDQLISYLSVLTDCTDLSVQVQAAIASVIFRWHEAPF
jgi:hypothetical protein